MLEQYRYWILENSNINTNIENLIDLYPCVRDSFWLSSNEDPDKLREEILADERINKWSFNYTYSENPPITFSQYIEISDIEDILYYEDVYVDYGDYTYPGYTYGWQFAGTNVYHDGFQVRYTVRNHVRIGKGDARAMMPRTEDMLAEINAITQEAFDYIGKIKISDDFKMIATTPIETVQLVQKTADGSISADCSSGKCECSKGFIDNGNGCTEMTQQQAATTQAPTTRAPTTPAQTRDWIPSLVDKIREIFEADRPGKPRTHLLKKWEKLSDKFNGRYESMANSGCQFPNTYDDDSMRTVLDFETIDACRVRSKLL